MTFGINKDKMAIMRLSIMAIVILTQGVYCVIIANNRASSSMRLRQCHQYQNLHLIHLCHNRGHRHNSKAGHLLKAGLPVRQRPGSKIKGG